MKPPLIEWEVHEGNNGAVVVAKCCASDVESPHGGMPNGWGELISEGRGEKKGRDAQA